MYFLLRLSPLLSALLSLAGLSLLSSYPLWVQNLFGAMSLQTVFVFSLLLLVLNFLTLIFIGAGHPFISRLRFYPFLFFTWASGLSVFFFTEEPILQWFLIIVLPLVSWIWLENLFLFWQRSTSYQAYSLQKLGNYLYLLKLFLFTTAVIGLQVLIQLPFWFSYLLSTIGFYFIQFDLFSLHKIQSKNSFVFAAFGTILGMELLLVLNLLPTHFFLYGLIIVLFYYVWNELVLQLLKQKKRASIKITQHILTATLGAVIAFFTTYFLR